MEWGTHRTQIFETYFHSETIECRDSEFDVIAYQEHILNIHGLPYPHPKGQAPQSEIFRMCTVQCQYLNCLAKFYNISIYQVD